MYVGLGSIFLIAVIIYVIIKFRSEREREQKYERQLISFRERYGKPPDDPDALKAYGEAMEREVGIRQQPR
jgi:hypothetical protein